MECHLSHFSFIVLIVLIYAALTFGIWTQETGLRVPDPGTLLTCVGWITFYGFKDDDFKYNKGKAKNRLVTLDEYASTWAAIYAYELSGSFHEADFLPQIFCKQHKALDNEYPFLRLRDDSRTCTDWLFLYGYTNDVENNNIPKALARNESLDEYLFLFVDGYGQAVADDFTYFYFDMSPSNYCLEMSQTEGSLIQFINRQNTQLTCERWLKLYGFTDNGEYNYNKVKNLKLLTPYNLFKTKYVKLYSEKLENSRSHNAESPLDFCKSQGYEDNETDFFEPVKFDYTSSEEL